MSFLEVFKHENMLHAAAVHMPIVFALLGLPLVIASLIFRRSTTLRILTLINYLLMAGCALFAERTGEGASRLVSSTLPAEIWKLIEQHEALAERVKFAAFVVIALLLLTLLPHKRARVTFSFLAVIAALTGLYFVTAAAHDGGTLVYHHGVGTPFRETMTSGIAPVFPAPVPHATPVEVPVVTPVAASAPQNEVPAEAAAPEAALVAPPAEPENALAMAVEPPAQSVNTGVLPVTEALNNPAWIPVRDIDLEAAKAIVFSRDIWPIIDNNCIDCHSSPDPDGEYDMSTRENLLKRGHKGGAGVLPGEPDNSAIIHYVRGIMQPQMPKKAPPLSEEDVHLLRSWIAAGAIVDAEPGA